MHSWIHTLSEELIKHFPQIKWDNGDFYSCFQGARMTRIGTGKINVVKLDHRFSSDAVK